MEQIQSQSDQIQELLLYTVFDLRLRYQHINDDVQYWKSLQFIHLYDVYKKQLDQLKTITTEEAELLESQVREGNTLLQLWENYKQISSELSSSIEEGGFQEQWADFRLALEQRLIPEYCHFLDKIDIIARDCYYPLLRAVEDLTGRQWKEFSGWLSPITVLKLSKRYEIEATGVSPVPLIVVPFDRQSNVWNLCAIHHEVGHDFFSKLTHLPQYLKIGLGYTGSSDAYKTRVEERMSKIYSFEVFEQLKTLLEKKIIPDPPTTADAIYQRLKDNLPPEWQAQLLDETLINWAKCLENHTFNQVGEELQKQFNSIFDQLLDVLYSDRTKNERSVMVIARLVHLLSFRKIKIYYYDWLNELFADMIGLMLAGPAYINSFQEILFEKTVTSENSIYFLLTDFQEEYPSPYFRLLFAMIFAEEKLGFGREVQALRQRWYAMFNKEEGLIELKKWVTEMQQQGKGPEADERLSEEILITMRSVLPKSELLPSCNPDEITIEGVEGWLRYLVGYCWKAELAQGPDGKKINLRKIYRWMEVLEYKERLGKDSKKRKQLTKQERKALRRAISAELCRAQEDLWSFRYTGCRPRYLVLALRKVFEEMVLVPPPEPQWTAKLRWIFLESVIERSEVTNAFRVPVERV